jgi:hypothetical protein
MFTGLKLVLEIQSFLEKSRSLCYTVFVLEEISTRASVSKLRVVRPPRNKKLLGTGTGDGNKVLSQTIEDLSHWDCFPPAV